MNSTGKTRFIVVEGPIGVGKTSLARKLASHYGCNTVLEQADENPFLDRFYRDPRHFALPTQLFFLFQRARQLEALHQEDLFNPVRIADFLLEKDQLFAELTLAQDELALYRQAYQHLSLDSPAPDLVVYLQAPVDVLLRRIEKRGVAYEQHIEARYLEKLTDAYARLFYNYSRSPLLIVNAAEFNPVENDADFQQIAKAIDTTRRGRHYFNPAPGLA